MRFTEARESPFNEDPFDLQSFREVQIRACARAYGILYTNEMLEAKKYQVLPPVQRHVCDVCCCNNGQDEHCKYDRKKQYWIFCATFCVGIDGVAHSFHKYWSKWQKHHSHTKANPGTPYSLTCSRKERLFYLRYIQLFLTMPNKK